ncbi:dihydroxyacetone kinase subunit DhaK [Paenibacillus humicola]|uniref:dihydroxyacetone kinase subunit DhaK n=1 Tax=Paenibacillus humicola TaxID=3110540 RepID=UPI00237C4D09|nr:dihydroxyacetone kinase subunit DhaK [Paenibacillus humicola]
MKKLINNPEQVVDDMLAGFLRANAAIVRRSERDPRAVVRVMKEPDTVGVVIGGGSGHKPAFIGYVGEGMADGVAVGNIFASPSPYPILAAMQDMHQGKGILLIYGNYSGDCMNFSMAAELAEMEGIDVKQIIVGDDVASAPQEEAERRRGIAGEFFVYKIAGAKAQSGASLEEVYATTMKANGWVRSMGVALSPCSLPQTGKPSFTLGDDEMEIGLGVHGEPGVRRGPLLPARDVAKELVQTILSDFDCSGGEVAVLVNGLGSTSLMELYIMYDNIADELETRNVKIARSFVGEYVTSLEMGGCSLSILKLDDELKELLNKPARTGCLTL